MPRAFRERGLGHVRLRVKDEATDELLAGLTAQVRDCLAQGLIPILAYQGQRFKAEASPEALEAAVAWWARVGEHFAQAAPALSFDLLIEVTEALNQRPDLLNAYYERAVAVLRRHHPQRILWISPRWRSAPEALTELVVPSQAQGYLMVEWHFYASGPSKTKGEKLWTTGTEAERQRILDKIGLATAYQEATGLRTWVGAWMPGDYNEGDEYSVEEQVVFARFVAGALAEAGIPFAVNSDEKFFDRDQGRWRDDRAPVLTAILEAAPRGGR